uniref:Surfactant protein C n=1 Tax=Dromaius novaehollandiae TaxID=8790 RepID=A0A8C4JM60_DRONO
MDDSSKEALMEEAPPVRSTGAPAQPPGEPGGWLRRAGATALGPSRRGSVCQQLLISYRSWLQQACYVTRMDKDNIQGLDAVTTAFRRRQVSAGPGFSLRQAERQEAGAAAEPLADRSVLGTTVNVLCSTVPVYWA